MNYKLKIEWSNKNHRELLDEFFHTYGGDGISEMTASELASQMEHINDEYIREMRSPLADYDEQDPDTEYEFLELIDPARAGEILEEYHDTPEK